MKSIYYPSVSIIFVNFNGKTLLGKLFDLFLNSLKNQEYCGKLEIIAVDNNSNDNSPDLIRKLIPNVKLITFRENVGYIKAVNIAIKYAKGDYILVLNNDVILPRNFVQKAILRIKELEEKIGKKVVLVPLQIVRDGSKIFGMLYVVNSLGQALPLDYLISREVYHKLYAHIPRCWSNNFVDGAAFLFPRTIISELGGILFIPFFKIYFDDVELGLRMRAKNIVIAFCKDIIIYHRLYTTSRQVLQLNKYINFNVNRLIVFLSFIKGTYRKLLLAILLSAFDLVQLIIMAMRFKSSILKPLVNYLKELQNVWKYSLILSRYYHSINANMESIIHSFYGVIFIPKWLCEKHFMSKVPMYIVVPYLLLVARILQPSLYKKYKRGGFKYKCIETIM